MTAISFTFSTKCLIIATTIPSSSFLSTSLDGNILGRLSSGPNPTTSGIVDINVHHRVLPIHWKKKSQSISHNLKTIWLSPQLCWRGQCWGYTEDRAVCSRVSEARFLEHPPGQGSHSWWRGGPLFRKMLEGWPWSGTLLSGNKSAVKSAVCSLLLELTKPTLSQRFRVDFSGSAKKFQNLMRLNSFVKDWNMNWLLIMHQSCHKKNPLLKTYIN